MTSPSKIVTPEFPIKKLGRPVGSKNKPKAKKIILTRGEVELANKMGVKTEDYAKQKLTLSKKRKPAAAKSKPFKRPVNEQHKVIAKLLDDNLLFMKDNKELVTRINNLEHQAIGYRAVISYLSHQLELKP